MQTQTPHWFTLNPATQLVLWITLAITALNQTSPISIGLSVVTRASVRVYAAAQFVRLLKPSRWLMLSVGLILMLMTPGCGLITIFGFPMPGREGIGHATDQIIRVVLAMAMLAIMLNRLSVTELVAAARQLLALLHLPGVNPDRAALRPMLPLQRLEDDGKHKDFADWRKRFALDHSVEGLPSSIFICIYPFGSADKLMLFIVAGGSLAFALASLIQPTRFLGS